MRIAVDFKLTTLGFTGNCPTTWAAIHAGTLLAILPDSLRQRFLECDLNPASAVMLALFK